MLRTTILKIKRVCGIHIAPSPIRPGCTIGKFQKLIFGDVRSLETDTNSGCDDKDTYQKCKEIIDKTFLNVEYFVPPKEEVDCLTSKQKIERCEQIILDVFGKDETPLPNLIKETPILAETVIQGSEYNNDSNEVKPILACVRSERDAEPTSEEPRALEGTIVQVVPGKGAADKSEDSKQLNDGGNTIDIIDQNPVPPLSQTCKNMSLGVSFSKEEHEAVEPLISQHHMPQHLYNYVELKEIAAKNKVNNPTARHISSLQKQLVLNSSQEIRCDSRLKVEVQNIRKPYLTLTEVTPLERIERNAFVGEVHSESLNEQNENKARADGSFLKYDVVAKEAQAKTKEVREITPLLPLVSEEIDSDTAASSDCFSKPEISLATCFFKPLPEISQDARNAKEDNNALVEKPISFSNVFTHREELHTPVLTLEESTLNRVQRLIHDCDEAIRSSSPNHYTRKPKSLKEAMHRVRERNKLMHYKEIYEDLTFRRFTLREDSDVSDQHVMRASKSTPPGKPPGVIATTVVPKVNKAKPEEKEVDKEDVVGSDEARNPYCMPHLPGHPAPNVLPPPKCRPPKPKKKKCSSCDYPAFSIKHLITLLSNSGMSTAAWKAALVVFAGTKAGYVGKCGHERNIIKPRLREPPETFEEISKDIYHENLVGTRGFEPWSPIPSWTPQKKMTTPPLMIPKDGCQLVPPYDPFPPCRPKPCKTFPKSLVRFSGINDLFPIKVFDIGEF